MSGSRKKGRRGIGRSTRRQPAAPAARGLPARPDRPDAQSLFPAELALCDGLSAVLDDMGGSIALRPDQRYEIFMAAQLMRARSFFHAVRMLSCSGLPGPAAAVLRCLQEIQFVTEAIARDPESIDRLVDADERTRYKALEHLRNLPAGERADHVTTESIDTILTDVDKQARKTDVWQWAELAGRTSEYRTAYALLSNEVHASLRATEAHVQRGAAGEVTGLSGWLGFDKLAFHLTTACEFVLHIIVTMPEGWITEPLAQRIVELDDRKRQLFGKLLERQAFERASAAEATRTVDRPGVSGPEPSD